LIQSRTRLVAGPQPTLATLTRKLAERSLTSRELVEDCIARIDEPAGEGARTFISVDREGARVTADAFDRLRASNVPVPRLAGIPVAIKDLFDIAGQVTRAGSRALEGEPPATRDAASVARLRRAGLIPIGRANMTEFAFSGLGINPHYGTPASQWHRDERRVPGGSSSGSAVAVADEMAHAALGTDTGGSCRIPAAFNGLVGFKPTAARVPTAGAVPLSISLDSIGPIGRSVACCAALDEVLSEQRPESAHPALDRLLFGVPTNVVMDGIELDIAATFEQTLSRLSACGVSIERMAIPEFNDILQVNSKGGLAAAESYAWHRHRLRASESLYDPRVSSRIRRGVEQTAADYIDVLVERSRIIRSISVRLAQFDAIVFPTVPIAAPKISDLQTDESYARVNLLVLRNPTLVNMIDGCAISIPMHAAGQAPAGFTIAGLSNKDHDILQTAAVVEGVLRS
jgi:aspartyl-tRNA(Asn)/glutamyl-tRNA(Gln) amidotransferase subunit A